MSKKKNQIIIAVLLVISVCLLILSFRLYRELQREAAKNNFGEWKYLYQMVERIDEEFVQNENWREIDLYLYENSVVYHVSDTITPAIGSGGSGTTFRFLCTGYNDLFRGLTQQDVDEALREEGFQLFADMNTDLKEICTYVFEKCANDEEMMEELIKEDSELYQEIKRQLDDFCLKYEEPCDEFWKKVY